MSEYECVNIDDIFLLAMLLVASFTLLYLAQYELEYTNRVLCT